MAGKKQSSVGGGLGCLAVVGFLIASCGSQGGTGSGTPSDSSALGIGGGDASSAAGVDTATSSATASSTPPPAVVATAAPVATPTPVKLRTDTCGAPPNPWGYGFCHGSVIYVIPDGFCTYFNCIPSFGDSSGYLVECNDGEYSNAGGRSGACSHHGGEYRALLKA